jgi:AcrR family transcriptional regulator
VPTIAATEDLHETKRSILQTAERLFAEHGFRATSLRAITARAQVNLGAVNYHFESKDALILAVLKRRMKPLNAARVALLDKFEVEAGGKPVAVEKILEALFRPVLELIAQPSKGGRYFLRLLALSLAEPGAFVQPLIQEEFAERNRRFHAAIRRAVPYLSCDEVHWRLHFANGVFLHTVAHAHVLEFSSGGRCRLGALEPLLRRLVSFCAPGLKNSDEGKMKNGNS